MKPKKAAHVKTSKPGSKSPKKVRREPEEIKAVETTAIALLAAIHKAIEAEIRPSEKAFGTLNKVVDATAKFAALPPYRRHRLSLLFRHSKCQVSGRSPTWPL